MPLPIDPLVEKLRNAIGTAGRGGAHRHLLTRGTRRLRRGSATAILLALLVIAPVSGAGGPAAAPQQTGTAAADRAADRAAEAQEPSRSLSRAVAGATVLSAPQPRAAAPRLRPAAQPPPPPPEQEPEPEPEPQPEPAPEPAPEPEPEPAPPAPIGGLDARQMEHAATIVRIGQQLGLPEYAYVVGIATALQESFLRVYASPVVPESFNYPHDATGADHDSVGLFQQRPSQGWGTVAQCMDPQYATRTFYQALQQIAGWDSMPVAAAAQAVQNSAFPDYYAQHEPLARALVAALA